MTLRSRLLLWSGAASAAALGLVILLADVSFRSQATDQLEEALVFARQVATEVRARQLDVRISEAVSLSRDTRLRAAVSTADVRTVRETLAEVTRETPAAWAAVVTAEGAILAATKGAPVAQIQDAEALLAEALYFDTADLWLTDRGLVDVAASALLFGASPLAVLVVGHPLDAAGVTSLETAVGRPVAVLTANGATLGTQASARLTGVEGLGLNAGQGLQRVEANDERYLAAGTPLLSSRGDRLGTAFLFGSYEAALQPADDLRALLIGILVLGLALTLAVGTTLARGITAPVARLLEDTERLATGDLEEPVVPMRDDEIGRLAGSFDAMRIKLRRARSELIRAERLGAIGKAASAVAHDFTQPLSTIAGAVGLLKVGGVDDAMRARCCDAIENELDRLGRMKQEIVEFARGEDCFEGSMIKFDSFLENTVSALRDSLAQRNIELVVRHGYGGTWFIDAYRLGRMLENLVRNAAAAIDRDGTVELRSAVVLDHLVVAVQDDGCGIPEDILPDIFEPFLTYGKKEGTGLGLAIARNVVEQHDGVIEVTSSPEGTTFTVSIPRQEPPPRAVAAPEKVLATEGAV